jgi:hypothetical protein
MPLLAARAYGSPLPQGRGSHGAHDPLTNKILARTRLANSDARWWSRSPRWRAGRRGAAFRDPSCFHLPRLSRLRSRVAEVLMGA